MIFLHRPDTDEYITIHRQDEQYLDELVNSNFFYDEYKNPSNQLRFNIVKDKEHRTINYMYDLEDDIKIKIEKLAKEIYNNGDYLTIEEYFGIESKYQ